MARTPTGSSLSTRPSSEPGTAGATPSSRRFARPGCARMREWPSRCWTLLGTTTGRCCRTQTESNAGSAACAGGLLEELPQLLGSDRRVRSANSGREQLHEAAEADVVEHGRGLDDLRRGFAMLWIEDAAEAVREVVWQLAHGLAETIKPVQPVVIGDVIWEPSPEVIQRSRLKRFMDRHGIETFDELLRRADDDIEWFWDAVIKDLGVAFYRDYDKVVDLSQGKAWARWWIGARMNIIASCLDRHRDGEFASKPAIIWEGEPGDSRTMTYGELDQQVSRLAGALRKLGVRQGDRIGIFMPMCPEVAGRRSESPDLRRRFLPPRSGHRDEGDRGPRARELPDRQEGDRPPARRTRDPMDAWTGRGLGSAAGGPPRPREHTRARSRGPADDHLHVGHDGQAERDAARAWRVSHQVSARHGALLRHRPRRRRVLVHRHRLDDGSLAHLRHAAAGRHDGALRGHTGPPRGGPPVADGRQAPGHRARRFPDARA